MIQEAETATPVDASTPPPAQPTARSTTAWWTIGAHRARRRAARADRTRRRGRECQAPPHPAPSFRRRSDRSVWSAPGPTCSIAWPRWKGTNRAAGRSTSWSTTVGRPPAHSPVCTGRCSAALRRRAVHRCRRRAGVARSPTDSSAPADTMPAAHVASRGRSIRGHWCADTIASSTVVPLPARRPR